MYDITSRTEVVREIKRYLYLVSEYVYPEIGRNTIDGIYDSSVAESIKKYQKIKSIPATGAVDLKTFTHLYSDFDKARNKLNSKGYVLTDDGFPISLGDMSEDVRIIHGIIGELKNVFSELYDVGNGSYYSKRTAGSVRMLREIFGFDKGEHIDEPLYLRMLEELASHKRNARTNDLKAQKRV
jgi:hypothetical protein